MNDGKLVARQTGKAGGFRQQRLDTAGNALEQAVANLLAQPVVHHPEAVKVDDHHGQPRARRCGDAAYRAIQPVDVKGVVRQAGDDVIDRVGQHPLLRLALLRGIRQNAGQPQARFGGIGQRAALEGVPAIAAVRVAETQLLIEALVGTHAGRFHDGVEGSQVVRVQQVRPACKGRIVHAAGLIAKQRLELLADEERTVVRLVVPHNLLAACERQGIALGLDRIQLGIEHARECKVGQHEGERHQNERQAAHEYGRGEFAGRAGGSDVTGHHGPHAQHEPDQKRRAGPDAAAHDQRSSRQQYGRHGCGEYGPGKLLDQHGLEQGIPCQSDAGAASGHQQRRQHRHLTAGPHDGHTHQQDACGHQSLDDGAEHLFARNRHWQQPVQDWMQQSGLQRDERHRRPGKHRRQGKQYLRRQHDETGNYQHGEDGHAQHHAPVQGLPVCVAIERGALPQSHAVDTKLGQLEGNGHGRARRNGDRKGIPVGNGKTAGLDACRGCCRRNPAAEVRRLENAGTGE